MIWNVAFGIMAVSANPSAKVGAPVEKPESAAADTDEREKLKFYQSQEFTDALTQGFHAAKREAIRENQELGLDSDQ